MNRVEIVANQLQKQLNLETVGFVMYEFNTTHLHYYRQVDDVKHMFMVGVDDLFRGDDPIPYSPIVRYAGFSAGLHINVVEDVLLPLVSKHLGITVRTDWPSQTILFNNYTGEMNAFWLALRSHSPVDLWENSLALEALAKVIQQQINLHLEPFWQQYSNLQFINDEIIQKVEQMQLHKYLGVMTAYKKLIIMKLCNNPNYASYRDWLVDINESDYRIDAEKWGNEYNMVNELVSALEQL